MSAQHRGGFFNILIRYRELIFFLVYREFRVRYKQTILGVSWAILQPLSQMLIFTIVFFHFAKFKSEGVPYPIFVLSGLLPWSIFVGALTRGIPIFLNYGNLVTKIYFPRIVLPIAVTFGLIIDFLCSFVVFLLLYLYFGLPLHSGIFFSFLIVFVQFIFTVGLLCIVATITVYFRDLTYAVPLLLQLWMFGTPVVYSLDAVPVRFRFWYDLNPMVGLIHNYRQLLLYHGLPDWVLFWKALVICILVFCFGHWFLRKNEVNLADFIGTR